MKTTNDSPNGEWEDQIENEHEGVELNPELSLQRPMSIDEYEAYLIAQIDEILDTPSQDDLQCAEAYYTQLGRNLDALHEELLEVRALLSLRYWGKK
jgi:hypothetical protein